MNIFSRDYEEIGSSNKGLLLKNSGKIKIQWGNKYIDLLDLDGNLNVKVKTLIKAVNSEEDIKSDGFYFYNGKLISKVGDEVLELTHKTDVSFVSFLVDQDATSSEKYTAMKNIGLVYKSLEDVNTYPTSGIIYIEDSLSIFIVNDGVLSKYSTSIPNPYPSQFVISKEDSEEGALVIEGEGSTNSLKFDSLKIYSNLNQAIFEANKRFLFNISNVKVASISLRGLEIDTVLSIGANDNYGFRLYKIGNKGVLDSDEINARELVNSKIVNASEEVVSDIIRSDNYSNNDGYKLEETNGTSKLTVDEVIARESVETPSIHSENSDEDTGYLITLKNNKYVLDIDKINKRIIDEYYDDELYSGRYIITKFDIGNDNVDIEVNIKDNGIENNSIIEIPIRIILNNKEEIVRFRLTLDETDLKFYFIDDDNNILTPNVNDNTLTLSRIDEDDIIHETTYEFLEDTIKETFLRRSLYVVKDSAFKLKFDFKNPEISLISGTDLNIHFKINSSGLYSDNNKFIGAEFHPIIEYNQNNEELPLNASNFPKYSLLLYNRIPVDIDEKTILPIGKIRELLYNPIEDLTINNKTVYNTWNYPNYYVYKANCDSFYDGKIYLFKVLDNQSTYLDSKVKIQFKTGVNLNNVVQYSQPYLIYNDDNIEATISDLLEPVLIIYKDGLLKIYDSPSITSSLLAYIENLAQQIDYINNYLNDPNWDIQGWNTVKDIILGQDPELDALHIIDRWNELVAFLDGISDDDLSTLLGLLNAKSDKATTVTNVGYSNNKFTQTINGTTTDIVSASTIVTDGGAIKTIKIGNIAQTVTNNTVNLPAYPTLVDLMTSSSIGSSTRPVYWNGSTWVETNLANLMGSLKGNATTPIYWSGTEWVNCNSIPSVTNFATELLVGSGTNANKIGLKTGANPSGTSFITVPYASNAGTLNGHTDSYFATVTSLGNYVTIAGVINQSATLVWNTAITLATIEGVDITAKLPTNPNTTYSFVTGDNNGLIKITPTTNGVAGTAVNVSVKGLKALAYKESLVASDIPNISWNKITSDKPTTLAGYGIIDAKIVNGVITLGSNTITPLTSFTETDPIFTSSAAYGISQNDITSWNNKGTYSKPSGGIPKTDLASSVLTSLGKADTALLSYTETDPIFTVSAAYGITSSDISSWNSKGTYSKPSGGIPKTDLASAVQTSLGKADTALLSYTETDPIFSASAAAGITSQDITNWNAAEANVLSNWTETNTSSDAFIKNKPTKLSLFTNDSGFTTNVGTVTSVATGIGLTGGNITTSGTIKAKLKDETANTADSSKSTSSDGGLYSVEVDKSGYLAVRVPWKNSTYTVNNGTYTVKTKVGDTVTNVSDFTANLSGTDDVTFIAGTNVSLTPDTTNRTITISSTDTNTHNSHGHTFTASAGTALTPAHGGKFTVVTAIGNASATTGNLSSTYTTLEITLPSETTLSKGVTIGDGNAVTDISVNGHTITLSKNTSFSTIDHNHDSIYVKKTGDSMTGPLTWSGSSAISVNSSPEYFLCMDAFARGGTTKYATKANVLKALTQLTSTAIGDSDEPIYWNGSKFVKCDSFSISGHNHDSVYVLKSGDTMTGRLYILLNQTQSEAKTSPINLQLVINGPNRPEEGWTDELRANKKLWPGIGFHMPNVAYSSLIFNGEFQFINGTYDGYLNVKAAKFITNGGTSSQFVKGDGSLDSNTYSTTSHTHSVKINGSTKTIAAPGGTAVDLGNYVPLVGANYNTNTDSNPFIFSRLGHTLEAMAVMINDSRTLFLYTNDESNSSIVFQLINTDTEGSDGSGASDRNVTISSSNSGIGMYVGGNLVIHAGNYTSYVNTTNFPGLNKTGTITGVSVNGTSVATSGVANITSIPASILSGAIANGVTATTQSSGDNSTKVATTAYVDTAISNLPDPMVFKGSLGTNGTITSLPTAASTNKGHTYKVITAGTYASQSTKIGDTFISDGSSWVLIPSGDEPSGTVTSITIKATSPISIDSSSAITSSGTRTLSHANSGVTAGTYKSVTVNATGHVTAGTNPTTLSGYGITDSFPWIELLDNGSTTAGTWLAKTTPADLITSYTDGLTIKYKITVAGSSNTYLNINGIGNKQIYRWSSAKLTTHYPVGTWIYLVYSTTLNSGSWVTVGGGYDSTYSAGTKALFDLGTNTTNRVWPASVLAETVAAKDHNLAWSTITNTPTTLSGYGITDAKIANGVITLGSNTITPLTSFTETDPVFSASAAAGISSSDITNWNGKTSNTGTVTSVATGIGLTGGSITTLGTIKAKLKSETANTSDSARSTSTDGGLYSVEVDKSGYLAVRVPWKNTTYTVNNATYTIKTKVGSTTTSVSDFTANQSSADDVTFILGTNVTLTPDTTNRTITIAATDTTYSSKAAASGGTDVSLVTTGEKYTWNNKSTLTIGTTASTAAAGNHTHTLSIAADSGTNNLTLAHGTKYKLTAGGNTFIFTMPASDNTDTKVTSVDDHYSPTANANSELTASLSGAAGTYAKDTEYTVLTGVKALRDAKGHITGLTYTALKIKDTNTTYTVSNGTFTIKSKSGDTTTNVSDFTANLSAADDITFIQGSNITLTPNTTNRTITIAATDTNTDSKVSQSATTTSNWRKIILSYQNSSEGAAVSSNTDVVYASVGVEVQPSTNTLKAAILRASNNSLYIGASSNSLCHQEYDDTNKCLKFIFD